MTATTANDNANQRLRWARAASWARGQSLGPYGQDAYQTPVEQAEWLHECKRIERLRDRIIEVGEDQAWEETS